MDKFGIMAETELMQLELQKSGANQKKYRCEKFAFDVPASHHPVRRKSTFRSRSKRTRPRRS